LFKDVEKVYTTLELGESDGDIKRVVDRDLSGPLPVPWFRKRSQKTGQVYYVDITDETSTFEHPLMVQWKELVRKTRDSRTTPEATRFVQRLLFCFI